MARLKNGDFVEYLHDLEQDLRQAQTSPAQSPSPGTAQQVLNTRSRQPLDPPDSAQDSVPHVLSEQLAAAPSPLCNTPDAALNSQAVPEHASKNSTAAMPWPSRRRGKFARGRHYRLAIAAADSKRHLSATALARALAALAASLMGAAIIIVGLHIKDPLLMFAIGVGALLLALKLFALQDRHRG